MILVSPFFGLVIAGFLIGIALIIIGIQMIAAGFSGRETDIVPTGFKDRLSRDSYRIDTVDYWINECNLCSKQLIDSKKR